MLKANSLSLSRKKPLDLFLPEEEEASTSNSFSINFPSSSSTHVYRGNSLFLGFFSPFKAKKDISTVFQQLSKNTRNTRKLQVANNSEHRGSFARIIVHGHHAPLTTAHDPQVPLVLVAFLAIGTGPLKSPPSNILDLPFVVEKL